MMMKVEPGMSSGGEKFPAHSSSTYHQYPQPEATYEDVMASRELFMETLKKLHASMGTKFMIPVVGGKGLDLYLLFVEVTSRGGIAKVVKERKWKEVTSVFNFPSSATNASFILRKYYVSLLYHYEQVYFFKAKCWIPSPVDALQNAPAISQPDLQHKKEDKNLHMHEVPVIPSTGTPVYGVIHGKFESGYLITVRVGSEDLQGVLYQVPNTEPQITRRNENQPKSTRRKRRKKSEIRRRDPSHPKPNRSGYNFFFAEQHALLKPHYHGRDREISRIIGETWNKLQDHERSVYQEMALKDKERYKTEMADYRERLRTGQPVQRVVPVKHQQPLVADLNLADIESDLHLEGAMSAYAEETEMGSDNSEKSNVEESESEDGNDSISDGNFGQDMELRNVNVEAFADGDLQMRADNQLGRHEKDLEDCVMEGDDKKLLPGEENLIVRLGEEGSSVPIEEKDRSNALI